MTARFLVVGTALLVSVLAAVSQAGTIASHRMSRTDTKSLALAIEDEIYDRGYEGDYFPIGGAVGEAVSDTRTVVPMYVDPVIDGGEGRVIYKLMPYGEVLRLFHVHRNGAVVLDGDPELGFPATQPNRKTVYLRDAEVSGMKRAWIKSSFKVMLSPGDQRLRESAQRQKLRTGFSEWESTHGSHGGSSR